MHRIVVRGFYTSVRVTAVAAGVILLASCGSTQPPAPYRAVASVDQVMDAIIIPSSQAIFDAVVYENGSLVQAPAADDDWFRLQMHALAVAEAGNLLLMPPRARSEDEWRAYSHGLTDAAVAVADAAAAKDLDAMLQTGSDLYAACTACHRKYLPME
jgi:hypothetical protein